MLPYYERQIKKEKERGHETLPKTTFIVPNIHAFNIHATESEHLWFIEIFSTIIQLDYNH